MPTSKNAGLKCVFHFCRRRGAHATPCGSVSKGVFSNKHTTLLLSVLNQSEAQRKHSRHPTSARTSARTSAAVRVRFGVFWGGKMVGGDAARDMILEILSRGDAGRKGNEASTALLAGIESERTRCRLLQERLDEMRKQHGDTSTLFSPLHPVPFLPVPFHPSGRGHDPSRQRRIPHPQRGEHSSAVQRKAHVMIRLTKRFSCNRTSFMVLLP